MNRRGFVIGLGSGLLIASTMCLIGYIFMLLDLREDSENVEAPAISFNERFGHSSEDNDSEESGTEPDMVIDSLKFSNEGDQNTSQEEEKKPQIILITQGDSNKQIAENLFNKGLIGDKDDFEIFLDDAGLYVKPIPGTYEIPYYCNYDEILDILSQ